MNQPIRDSTILSRMAKSWEEVAENWKKAGVYPAHINGYKKGAVLLKKAAEFARRAGN